MCGVVLQLVKPGAGGGFRWEYHRDLVLGRRREVAGQLFGGFGDGVLCGQGAVVQQSEPHASERQEQQDEHGADRDEDQDGAAHDEGGDPVPGLPLFSYAGPASDDPPADRGEQVGPVEPVPDQGEKRGDDDHRSHRGERGDRDPGEPQRPQEGHREQQERRQGECHRDRGEHDGASGGPHGDHHRGLDRAPLRRSSRNRVTRNRL